MSFRTVVISRRCKLDLRMGYLVIRNDDGTQRIFLDELNTLLIEEPACSITGCLLEELVKHKVKVIFCDSSHSPCAELLPCYGHGECSGKLREQIAWDQNFTKELWAAIVAEKIRNQACFLGEKGKAAASELLFSYIKEIEPGDITNREGHAAKVYFNALFGNDFRRGDGSAVDSALNYGYALILAAFNREVVAAGFSTQLGLFHHNTFNPYNLSCDLMEPFRILIDRQVDSADFDEFGGTAKRQILQIFNTPFMIEGSVRRLDDCIRLYTHSVFKAISAGSTSLLKFCSWHQ